MKKILKHIMWALLLIGIISLEIFMYLRGNGLLEAFEFKDIFFKGGTLDNFRFYDMRMTVLYLLSNFISSIWKTTRRADDEQRED